MQFHDVLTSPAGWTCSCTDSGTGGPEEADDHVIAAWEVERGLDNLDPWAGAPPVGTAGEPGQEPI